MKALPITVCAMLVLLVGCNSVAYRIEQSQAYFDSLTPEEQWRAQQEIVNPGDSRKFVLLVLGKPSIKTTIRTAERQLLVWEYTEVRYHYEREKIRYKTWEKQRDGSLLEVRKIKWVDVSIPEEYVTRRIQFWDGHVESIEEIER